MPIHALIITRLRLLDAAAREVGKLCQAMAPLHLCIFASLHLCICLHNLHLCICLHNFSPCLP